jgi:hypothetical protein
MTRAHPDNSFVSRAPGLDTLGKVLNTAEPILGRCTGRDHYQCLTASTGRHPSQVPGYGIEAAKI